MERGAVAPRWGNLKTRTDARGVTVTYQYDALNRLTKAVYGDQTVVLTWDACAHGVGRLCSVSDASGSTAFAYDAHGRLISKTHLIGSVSLAVGYAYTDGRLSGMTLPSGKAVVFERSEGPVTGLRVNGTQAVSGITYAPFGPVAGWTWGNGRPMLRTFDAAGRLRRTSLGSSVAGAADTRGLAHDAAGRIVALVDGLLPTLNQFHGYDHLDRLTSSRLTGASLTTYGYGYDLSGNRTTRSLNGVTTSYVTPATSNRLSTLTGGQAKAYGYDAAGNITSDGTISFGFDNAGRRTWSKVGATTTTYAYNALGQRVKKVGTTTTLYAYDEAGHLLGEYDASGSPVQETVWLDDIPVVTLRGTALYYVHGDHLNTPRQVTRPSDNKPVWSWEAEPFGNSLPNQNPAGIGNFVYNLRMPGQIYDAETGLSYNYYRDYDPGTGRYGESDPIGLEGGINTYAYVGGNPVWYYDLLGLERNPKTGRWQPRSPEPRTPSPIRDPSNDMKDRNDLLENLPEGLQYFRCLLGLGGCMPKEAFACVIAECQRECDKPFLIDYRTKDPIYYDSTQSYPPSPDDVPEGCKCIVAGPRGNGPVLNPPGL